MGTQSAFFFMKLLPSQFGWDIFLKGHIYKIGKEKALT